MKKTIVLVIAAVLVLGMLPTGAAAGKAMVFTDVKDTDWFKLFVDEMSGKGICEGYGNGLYGSQDNLQVDQLLKLVVIAMGYNPEACDTDIYWACKYIKKAKELGLVKDGEFSNYEVNIKRGEIARVIARGLSETYPANLDEYKALIQDYESVKAEDRQYVLKVYSKGIVCGYPDGRFGANDFATRAEASKMIINLINPDKRTLPTLVIKPNPSVPIEISSILKNVENTQLIDGTVLIYCEDGKVDSIYDQGDWFISKSHKYEYIISLNNYKDNILSSVKAALKTFYPTEYEKAYSKLLETINGKVKKDSSTLTYIGISNLYFDDRYYGSIKFDNGTSVYIGKTGVKY